MAMAGVQSTTSILTVVSGTIIDAIAALFFTQSNQARKLMMEFFENLVRCAHNWNNGMLECWSREIERKRDKFKVEKYLPMC